MTAPTIDKTDTTAFPMEGRCPFGGDRVGGAFGSPSTSLRENSG